MLDSSIDEILARLHGLQEELAKEIDRLLKEKREKFEYTLERGKVHFNKSIRAFHHHQRTGLLTYIRLARFGHIVTAPVIYSLIIPFMLIDFMATLYQQICFRVYGLPRVKRSSYFVFDRQRLAYLNVIEKFNCVYCSYGNSVISYVREIAARTEQYWCPIKHTRRARDPHHFEQNFLDYGDAEGYRSRIKEIRKNIASISTDD